MTAARQKVPLSVVIPTAGDPADLISRVDGLRSQVKAVGGELLVVATTPSRGEIPPDVCVHHLPGGSVFDCRAGAFSLAAGEIIAFTEDHCLHPPDWCARILRNYATRPELVLLGGAVANKSPYRIEDRMNYWMTFATYYPGHVTARHPCIAQFMVKVAALDSIPQRGELESAVILKFRNAPGAVFVDPELIVGHVQSHGFWNTFAVHYHNGRATGGLSPRRVDGRNLTRRQALRWACRDAAAHIHRTRLALATARRSFFAQAQHLLLIMPLVIAHGAGEFMGYRGGPGASPHRLQ